MTDHFTHLVTDVELKAYEAGKRDGAAEERGRIVERLQELERTGDYDHAGWVLDSFAQELLENPNSGQDIAIDSVERGCTCGGMAACPQCQNRDAND